MLFTRRNTSVSWSVTYIARQTCQVSAAFNLCLQSLDSGSTLTFTLRKNWIFDIYLLRTNPTWGLHKRLKRSSQNWATAESSHCCIINDLTSIVCAETNHIPLSWNSEMGVLLLSCAVKNWLLTLSEWAWNQVQAWNQVTRSGVSADYLDSVLTFWWKWASKPWDKTILAKSWRERWPKIHWGKMIPKHRERDEVTFKVREEKSSYQSISLLFQKHSIRIRLMS